MPPTTEPRIEEIVAEFWLDAEQTTEDAALRRLARSLAREEQARAEATRLALEGLAERVRRLPRFGVVDGEATPHHRGTLVQQDAVLALLSPPAERSEE